MNNIKSAVTNNMMTLMNGQQLNVYEKLENVFPQHANNEVNNTLALDAEDEYLFVARRKREIEQRDQERKEQREAFVRKLWFFYEHRDVIYQDSRMFMAPVPMVNRRGYSCPRGFRAPVLGGYMEWLECCEQAHVRDDNGMHAMIYQFAGSSRSGSNHCMAVNCLGETSAVHIVGFKSLWTSFMEINTRYDDYKGEAEAFDLEVVSEIIMMMKFIRH